MASVYRKGNKIYISWYDPVLGKVLNRSTKMKYTKDNLLAAKKIAEQLQAKINSELKTHKEAGIRKTTIQDAFDHFLRNNTGKDKKTISDYRRFFKLFTKTFPANQPCGIINKLKVEKWLSGFSELTYKSKDGDKKYERNSLYNFIKVLKKFLSFLFEYNYIPFFRLNRDVLIGPEVKSIIVYSIKDIKKIRYAIDEKDEQGNFVKNNNFRTMINLLLFTGLRPSDIINIRVEEIDFEKSLLNYYSLKTKEHFIIPLHPELTPLLKERCDEVGSGYILNYENVANMGKAFRRFLASIGLRGNQYNLRTFRKTFISLAYESGIELATVSKLVGHKQISTTSKYYHKLSVAHQAQELKKFQLPKTEVELK